jgi:hypothetical protein
MMVLTTLTTGDEHLTKATASVTTAVVLVPVSRDNMLLGPSEGGTRGCSCPQLYPPVSGRDW